MFTGEFDRMRIAFYVDRFPVLSTPFIFNQIAGLIDRGHTVDVYALEAGDFEHVHACVRDYRMLERLFLPPPAPVALPARWRDAWIRLRALPPAAQQRARATLDPRRFGKEALRLKVFYHALPWLEKGSGYDVVHAQFGTIGLIAAQLKRAGVLGDARLISHFRGWDVSAFVREHGEAVYAPLWAHGDLFLANCDFFRKRVLDLGAPAERTDVLRSGIELADFPFRERTFPETGAVRLLTVGRLSGKKGLEYAIEAVAALRRRGVPIEYRIVGDGPLRADLEALAEKQGVRAHVHLLGSMNHGEVRAEMESAHLFTAPSVTSDAGDQDAPVNVLKEAMASGLPVVSTWHGGIPELVEDGITGFLVPERDAEALAEKLAWLVAHPDHWGEMGRAGRARVEAEYDKERLNDRLVALYAQVLHQPARP